MGPSISNAALLLGVSYIIWRLIRPFVIKSPLAHIPGPPSASWFQGNSFRLLSLDGMHLILTTSGNFGQLFDIDGWDFHQNLADTYGAVCKVHGLFGVRLL